MTISTSLGIAIFLLGAAVGALLTRLQRNAFKQIVLQEIMKQSEDDPQPASDGIAEPELKSLLRQNQMDIDRKRLTNTPVGQAGFVLKCPDDRKNRVVSAQATFTCGGSAVGGRVCEQRYATE